MTEQLAASNKRLIHRELYASRAFATVVTGLILALVLSLLLLEVVIKVLGDRAFLIDLERTAQWAARLPADTPLPALVAGSIILVVLGVLLILVALLPGRRARYALPEGRAAVVVDAGVVAAALARRARLAAGVAPEQVLVTVGRRVVDVEVRPTSGFPVDAEKVRAAVEEDLRSGSLDRSHEVRVHLAPTGVIGQ